MRIKKRKPNIGLFEISEERTETIERQHLKRIAENFQN